MHVKVMKFNQASCADLLVSEEQLIASGKHVRMSYTMKPEAGSTVPLRGAPRERRAAHRERQACHGAYIMNPKTGYGDLDTIAHYAAESSTGTNVNVATPMMTSPSPSMRWCTTSTGGQGVQVRIRTCSSMSSMAAR